VEAIVEKIREPLPTREPYKGPPIASVERISFEPPPPVGVDMPLDTTFTAHKQHNWRQGDATWEQVPAKKVTIPGYENYDFYLHKDLDKGDHYVVSEGKTGVSMGTLTIRADDAIAQTAKILKRVGLTQLDASIKRGIENHGISPVYKSTEPEQIPAEIEFKRTPMVSGFETGTVKTVSEIPEMPAEIQFKRTPMTSIEGSTKAENYTGIPEDITFTRREVKPTIDTSDIGVKNIHRITTPITYHEEKNAIVADDSLTFQEKKDALIKLAIDRQSLPEKEKEKIRRKVFSPANNKKVAEFNSASTKSISDLKKIEESRSPRSQAMDERQTNAKVVSPTNPLIEKWSDHPGRMDVQGIDAPRSAKVTVKKNPLPFKFKAPKPPKAKTPKQRQGLKNKKIGRYYTAGAMVSRHRIGR